MTETGALLSDLLEIRFLLVAAAAAAAGFVRGFSGFGAAMIFMPIASALYEPTVAIVLLFVADLLVTAPVLVRSIRICTWPEVLPLGAGAALAVPLGAAILVQGDPVAMRWVISILVIALVVVLASGWRYERRPGLPTTIGIGGIAGLFGGMAGLSGPPVILFWLGGRTGAPVVRANIFVFFGFTTVVGGLSYAVAGLFTAERVVQGLMLVPLYGLALWVGSRLFGRTTEAQYRRVALVLCFLVALAMMPLWDAL